MYNVEFKRYVKSKAKTQKVFAEKVGVTEDYISSIIQGHNEITDSLYEKIKSAFGDIPEHIFKKSILSIGDNPINSINDQMNESPPKYQSTDVMLISEQLKIKDDQLARKDKQISVKDDQINLFFATLSTKDLQIVELLKQQSDLINMLSQKLNSN